VPQTSTDLMKALCRRRGGEFAKRPAMPPMSGEPWPGSGPRSPPSPRRAVRSGPRRARRLDLLEISQRRVRFRPVLFVFLT
jgi:hypothetical protein